MAAADVLHVPSMPRSAYKLIIESQSGSKRKHESLDFDPNVHLDFDPNVHLDFEEPESIVMMRDIGYTDETGISPVAVSEPFRLFSQEAVQRFRGEILSEQVLSNCSYSSNIAACHLRGYAPKYAPFVYDAWHNPKTLEIVSKIAGVELIPQMDYEIGHINILVKSEKQTQEELATVEQERTSFADDEGIAGCPWEDDKPVVGWHHDSFPFVCVTMLSDCTNMVGGETALRTGDGNVMRVRGPDMGYAVVMQGRYITHQALRSLGTQERITMVTSFRAKSPHLQDDSLLRTVRGISDLSEIYFQFSKYRLEMLEERIRGQLDRIREDHRAGKKTDTKAIKRFLDDQERFLHHTNGEMVPDEDVVFGEQPEEDIPDEKINQEEEGPPAKRAKVL